MQPLPLQVPKWGAIKAVTQPLPPQRPQRYPPLQQNHKPKMRNLESSILGFTGFMAQVSIDVPEMLQTVNGFPWK